MADDSVDFKSGPLGLKLAGPNAIQILLFISVLALGALVFWGHKQRAQENASMLCMIKLNLFVNQQPRDVPLDWGKMPVDLYPCVPAFLYRPNR